MKNIILFDNEVRDRLLPFTYTRPVCELRIGIFTIKEKWEKWFNGQVSFITQDFLSDKYDITISERNFLINGSVFPSQELCSLLNQMEDGEAFLFNGELIAAVLDRNQFNRLMHDDIEELNSYELKDTPISKLNNLWDIFLLNDIAIRSDYERITKGRKSQQVSNTNRVLGGSNIFVEPGAKIECATLNAQNGPIYIGENCEIMEGATIRGPFVLGDKSVVKMGAKIYGPTSIGPNCTVGGEIKNVVILGHSNKGHEGYLGNSVIGEHCNLGADTNCSNLKNNWSEVKVWDYTTSSFSPSRQLKAGLFMGDYSMAGINTMFNTGTVVGVCCNVFGANYPRNFIPSFSWGGSQKTVTYDPGKAFKAMENMASLHGGTLSSEDRLVLLKIYEESAKYRPWESAEETAKKIQSSQS